VAVAAVVAGVAAVGLGGGVAVGVVAVVRCQLLNLGAVAGQNE
jgi:hypothetical protein